MHCLHLESIKRRFGQVFLGYKIGTFFLKLTKNFEMLFFADEKKQLMASYDGDERCPVDNDSINCIYMLATAAKSTDPLGSDKSHVMVFYDPFGHSNQKTLRGLIMHIRSAGDYDNVKRPMKFEAKWIEFDVSFSNVV
jgi:hypothetical protein